MKIKSRIHERGHKHESEWPLEFGTGEKGRFYIDPDTGEARLGNPPEKIQRFGVAPQAIFPSMPAQYHEGVGRIIEDRKEWELADRQSGCLTFGSREEIKRTTAKGIKDEQREIKEDRRRAGLTSLQAYRENPKEVSARVRKQGEKQIEELKKNKLGKVLKDAGVQYE